MSTYRINGGVANQPDVPVASFGRGRSDGWFNYTIASGADFVYEANPEVITEFDRVFDFWASPKVGNTFDISLSFSSLQLDHSDLLGGVTVYITNNGGLILNPDNPFNVVSVESGNGVTDTVTVESPVRSVSIPLSGKIRSLETPVKQFKNFNPVGNFLSTHCDQSVTQLLGPVPDLGIYLDYNDALVTKAFQRNPNCWAASLAGKMTCFIAWNSNHTRHKSGTLITKRHMVNATHYNYPVGTNVIFVGPNNEVVWRQVIGRRNLATWTAPDITVYLLDEDVPEFIHPCKVLPANWENYFPTGVQHVAAISTDKFEELSVADIAYFSPDARFVYPLKDNKKPYFKNKVNGDSGNPVFIIVNGDLVLLSTLYSAGASYYSGVPVHLYHNYINDFILELDQEANISTGYTLTEVDLSGFYPVV